MIKKKVSYSILSIIFTLFTLWIISLSFPGKLYIVDQPRRIITKTFIDIVDSFDTKIAQIHPSFTYKYTKKGIPFSHLSKALDKITPGTIIFTDHGKSICSLIPGTWKHAMVYIGTQSQTINYFGKTSEEYQILKSYYKSGNEYLILDSRLHKGVYIHDITDLADLKTASTLRKLAIFIPKDKEALSIPIFNFAIGELGKKYDLDADLNNNSYYCSELVYKTIIETTRSIPIVPRKFPKTIISPTDTYRIARDINYRQEIFTFIEINNNFRN